VIGCVSSGNNAYGYQLLTGTSSSTFQSNEALSNSVAGFADLSGSAGGNANVFKMNEAFQNNGQNYQLMPAGTPIRTWFLSAGLQPDIVTDTALFTGSISGTILTVSDVSSGVLAVGDRLIGPSIFIGTIITGFDTGTGGTGTYHISHSQTVASESMVTTAEAPSSSLDNFNIL
jgi:hypothetical protein